MKSFAGSTMRCGSENVLPKAATSINACIIEMKEIRKGMGLTGYRQMKRAKDSACAVGSLTRQQEVMV